MILEAHAEDIRRLEETLAARDRRVAELEEIAEQHKIQAANALELLDDEMHISSIYEKRCEQFMEQLRIADYTVQAEKQATKHKMTNMSEELNKAEERCRGLEQLVDDNKTDLKTAKRELERNAKREIELKQKLNLPDDASARDLESRISKLVADSSELRNMQNQFRQICQEKTKLNERIVSLSHEKDRLAFDLRQTKIELQRLSRKRPIFCRPLDIKHRSSSRPVTSRPGYLRLPSIININDQPNPNVAQKPEAAGILHHTPKLHFGDLQNRTPINAWPPTAEAKGEREAKFCILCRTEYYLRKDCKIHTGPVHKGKYTCCGVDVTAKGNSGCKTISHMYVQFIGSGNDYCVYDDHGRKLDF